MSTIMTNANENENALAKVKANVEKLKEIKKNAEGNFLKFQSGDVKILHFTGDIEPVQRSFKRKNDKGEEKLAHLK